MSGMIPVVFCWSGGKDSALCLYEILQEKEYDVKYLLTTVNEQFRRVSMHGVREELLDAQAKSIGIPLVKVYVNEGTNEEYERKMQVALLEMKQKGISHVVFGDIFLQDLRSYRETSLSHIGMKAIFPLWKQDTSNLIQKFISLKFKTIICCTNDAYLGEEWAGKIIDESFISSLPSNIDACGENGEYHTFCFDGPIFKTPVNIKSGEKLFKPLEIKRTDNCKLPAAKKNGFWFCELLAN